MGLLDYLFGNGGRRFIKRKDSDAGEAGETYFIDFQTISFLLWLIFRGFRFSKN